MLAKTWVVVAVFLTVATSSWADIVRAQDPESPTAPAVETSQPVDSAPASAVSQAQLNLGSVNPSAATPSVIYRNSSSRPVYVNRTVVVRRLVRPGVYYYSSKVVKVQIGTSGHRALWNDLHNSGVVSKSYIDSRDNRIESKADDAVRTANEAKDALYIGHRPVITEESEFTNRPKEGNGMETGWFLIIAATIISIVVCALVALNNARHSGDDQSSQRLQAAFAGHAASLNASDVTSGVSTPFLHCFRCDPVRTVAVAPVAPVAALPTTGAAPVTVTVSPIFNLDHPGDFREAKMPPLIPEKKETEETPAKKTTK